MMRRWKTAFYPRMTNEKTGRKAKKSTKDPTERRACSLNTKRNKRRLSELLTDARQGRKEVKNGVTPIEPKEKQ